MGKKNEVIVPTLKKDNKAFKTLDSEISIVSTLSGTGVFALNDARLCVQDLELEQGGKHVEAHAGVGIQEKSFPEEGTPGLTFWGTENEGHFRQRAQPVQSGGFEAIRCVHGKYT